MINTSGRMVRSCDIRRFTPPPDVVVSKVIMQDRTPVIGTIFSNPTPGTLVEASVTFFEDAGCDPDGPLQTWKEKMWLRCYNWKLRYPGNFADRNIEGRYDERLADGRTECFCPDGHSLPPDGWLITPAWHHDRCIGQWMYFALGKRWLSQLWVSGCRSGELLITDRKLLLPIELYRRLEA
jgi:hypothetical protein